MQSHLLHLKYLEEVLVDTTSLDPSGIIRGDTETEQDFRGVVTEVPGVTEVKVCVPKRWK